jgi:RNA polymerase sigma factor (sigma-70 family)
MAPGQSDTVLRPLRALLENGSMAGMTDGQLLERFATNRDARAEAAFAALVARHGPMVLGTCRRLLIDEHAADDAFQAVFLVLARRAGNIRQPELLGPWLHGVAARVARKARARADRRRRHERSEALMSNLDLASPDHLDPSIASEDVMALHEEVARLPERYRRSVILCHFEGLTHAEAGRRLGCPPGTVGARVSRARDMLRRSLTRRGVCPSAALMAASIEPALVATAVPLALELSIVRASMIFAHTNSVGITIASPSALELAHELLKSMTMTKLTIVGVLALALSGGVAGAGLLATSAPGADKPERHPAQPPTSTTPLQSSSPSLPGAVTSPPAWLVNNAPFDVAAFFAAPASDENAASRYLDALFEFGPETAVCFPEGPERESRARAAEQRSKEFFEISSAVAKKTTTVPSARIDLVLDGYDRGFRKLDWAQQRPKCVFQTGIGATARIPHAQVARQVARIVALKVAREIERAEFDAALRDLKRLLRLSRDLRPRGVMISQIVSAAIDQNAFRGVVLPILSAPGVTISHCDSIIALLAEHQAQSIDSYSEGVRAEYLSNRATLHELIHDQQKIRQEWESFGNKAGQSIVAEFAEPALTSVLAGNAPMPRPTVAKQIQALASQLLSVKNVPDLDALMAGTTPEQLAGQVENLNKVYGVYLQAAGTAYQQRIRKVSEQPVFPNPTDVRTRVTRGLLPATAAFTQSLTMAAALTRITQGLAAVRRWQLRHGGDLPPSLAAAVQEAGMPAVPIDPYDIQPVRFSVVAGQPTVYCVGQDAQDGGGTTDAARSPQSGDVLLRLFGKPE